MRPNPLTSSLFQMKRHTRRPPPTCKSSWREGRIAATPFAPGVLTGWVRWINTTVVPPINVAVLIDIYAQSGPTEYFGVSYAPGVTFTLSFNTNADPNLFDLVLTVETPTFYDDDSWHDLPRPAIPCEIATGILSNIHTPGADENYVELSL